MYAIDILKVSTSTKANRRSNTNVCCGYLLGDFKEKATVLGISTQSSFLLMRVTASAWVFEKLLFELRLLELGDQRAILLFD